MITSRSTLSTALPLLLAIALPAQTVVFTSNFDGALPAQVAPGVAQFEGVQGYAGLGPAGDQFGGTFLRSPTGNVVTIQLTGLPPHNAIQLDFLFAAIDSLDGTGSFPSGDFFRIDIDGNTFFRESFANALPSQIQSYTAPPGVTLARMVDLGFSGPGSYYTDSAYWLGGDPQFQAIGHSAATLTLTLQIEGPGIQSLGDESWAIDNLTIRALQASNPGSVLAYGTSCGPTLSAFGVPAIGQSLPIFAGNLPASTLVAGLAFGLTNAAPFPLALDFLGAPGCFMLHDASLATGLSMLVQLPAATFTLPIPNNPPLVGAVLFLQSWAFAPGVNDLGIVTSNGLRVQIGH
jgi:hypothetical protein